MNEEERDVLAQFVSNKLQHNLEENEDLENLLNILGKPIMDAKPSAKPTLDEISSLRYVNKTSDKGAYKTASKTDNPNNAAFLKLQKYLKEHKGFAILHGFKFWQFSNNPDVIGRRKQ